MCIAEENHCEAEMARQPALVKAIKAEMASQEFRVCVGCLEISESMERSVWNGVKCPLGDKSVGGKMEEGANPARSKKGVSS